MKQAGSRRHFREHTRIPWGRLLGRLMSHYEMGDWRTPVLRKRGEDPFLVMVSTMLSQRTRDEVTQRATLRLLSHYPTPTTMARAPVNDIETLVREVGLSHLKARGLRDAARFLVSRHKGVVPRDLEELLEIPRVGPKTAHAILVFGHSKPALPIDTHILRVCRRLGATRGRNIPDAQKELVETVPSRYWGLLNPILVQHGMNTCRHRDPFCGACPIARWCKRIGLPSTGAF